MDNSNFEYENINNNEENRDTSEVVSVKDWTIYNIVVGLPLVGFIFLIIKALDRNNPSVGNWAKASLLIKLVGMILFILLMVFLFAIIAKYANNSDPRNYFNNI